MNLRFPTRPRFRWSRTRALLAVASGAACLGGLSLTGAAQGDAPIFAPTLTVGQPISRSVFPYQSFVPGHVSVVPDPDGSGVAVIKYSVDNSDQPYAGAKPRADLITRPWYTNGSTLFTSIPVKIPAGLAPFRASGSSFYQFAEAKDTAANTPSWGLGLRADSSGRDHYFFGTTTEIGDYGNLWLGPVLDGRWHTFVVAAKYTSTPGRGWVRLYMDGQPVTFNLGRFAGQTRATGVTTIVDGAAAWPLDINSYRSRNSLDGMLTMYHGVPKIGPTLPSVIGGPAPGVPPVSVVASPRSLKAGFTASPHTSAVGQRVRFSSKPSTGTPLRYVWSVGRRTVGTRRTLTYRFRSAGTKHVRLKITGADGATSTVSHAHIVHRRRHRSSHRRAKTTA